MGTLAEGIEPAALSLVESVPMVLIDGSIKGAIILGMAGALLLIFRRASAATRHMILLVALGAMLLIPILSLAIPSWRIPIESRRVFVPGPEMLRYLLIFWALGAACVLTRAIIGHHRLNRIAQKSQILQGGSWCMLVRRACNLLRLDRPITLVRSYQSNIPMTWGINTSMLLVPCEADDWSPQRRKLVLLHELAHVKRRDCLTQLIAQAVCTMYWFHPLAWAADRLLRLERERACDDMVIKAGYRPSEYAEHLLHIARKLKGGDAWAAPAHAMAMSRSSPPGSNISTAVSVGGAKGVLEGRIVSILSRSQDRRSPKTSLIWLSILTASFLLVPMCLIRVF